MHDEGTATLTLTMVILWIMTYIYTTCDTGTSIPVDAIVNYF